MKHVSLYFLEAILFPNIRTYNIIVSYAKKEGYSFSKEV